MSTIKTYEEQRTVSTNRAMLSIGLEAKLRLLIDKVISGEPGKLAEFQQMVQYAPPKMRARILDLVDRGL